MPEDTQELGSIISARPANYRLSLFGSMIKPFGANKNELGRVVLNESINSIKNDLDNDGDRKRYLETLMIDQEHRRNTYEAFS